MAVVVTSDSEVVIWQAHLPLLKNNMAWTVMPIYNGPTPRLEIDFLCVLHDEAIWLIPVNEPKVVFLLALGKVSVCLYVFILSALSASKSFLSF